MMTTAEKEFLDGLVAEIRKVVQGQSMRFMEVCGTHTMSIFQEGLRTLLPSEITLISGPGCPVCVTPAGEIAQMVELSLKPEVILCTFGDLVRVPGSRGSLAEARACGADVQVVYSPSDALAKAEENPAKDVVFLGIGFETTIPSVAATIIQAHRKEIGNFFVYPSHKLMPPALDKLLSDPELEVDGLLCPGHVCTIIGTKALEPLAETHEIPCVVAGFRAMDILLGIYMLAIQVKQDRAEVENAYQRAVTRQGNKRALEVTRQVFRPTDATWRGLGPISRSGMGFREEFKRFDARRRFMLEDKILPDPKGCKCAQVIKGMTLPPSCPLFSSTCSPLNPVGPCMVSSEGTCAAYYKYGGL